MGLNGLRTMPVLCWFGHHVKVTRPCPFSRQIKNAIASKKPHKMLIKGLEVCHIYQTTPLGAVSVFHLQSQEGTMVIKFRFDMRVKPLDVKG